MTRQRRVMLGTAWATFVLGTIVSISLNATMTGCSSVRHQQVEAPSDGQGTTAASSSSASADQQTTAVASSTPEPEDATPAPKPRAFEPSLDDCMPRYLGATKAAPVLPPGCERPRPAAPNNQRREPAPQQAP